MEENKSKVYIKVDENNNVVAIDGGYSIDNIKNLSEWILIDEGTGDKFNLCQNNYLEKSLMDFEHNLYRYAYINGNVVEKDLTSEIEAWEERNRLETIRQRREAECFPIINRGGLWYSRLTDEQLAELNDWYDAWLDAPETLVVPQKPAWLE